ncbi:MAG: DJ-1/PfpI family protein [Sedimentisphaerales bacterium]|nr:DJ-1/PfpI family protein [Sedimentisphaerales bacterium]
MTMAKTALVPIADGTEEIEAVTVIDTLRRAGVEVTVASVGSKQVKASRRVTLVADCGIAECLDKAFDLIVLPGGLPGAEYLRDSAELTKLLEDQVASGRLYGAICASPAVVLAHHGLVKNRKITGYPTTSDKLRDHFIDKPVVVDQNCITSQGPATAMAFSLKLVELLCGKPRAEEVAKAMLFVR